MFYNYIVFFFKCLKGRGKYKKTTTINNAIKVLKTINKTKKNINIEKIRLKLLKQVQIIHIEDLGAGSKLKKNNERKISYIVKSSVSKTKYCKFYRDLIEEFDLKKVLEFGTSLGITSMYMKSAKNNPDVITVEGDKGIAKIAKNNFLENNKNKNIELLVVNFDDFLLDKNYINTKFDLIFLDGNHRKEATIRYFKELENRLTKNAIFIFDDIRWSKGMYEAWQEIYLSKKNGLFLDLFKIGIYFKDDFCEKKYFTKCFL